MKRTYTCLLCLILSLCAGAQPPHIITSDLANFWNAYDSVTATTDSAAQVRDIQHLYLDKASDGLKDMIKIRHWNARIFQLVIKRYPAFWTSIRPKIMGIRGQLPMIEGLLSRYEQLFPLFQMPEICFTVGYLGTGGTTTQTRVLIGSEIAAADSTVNATGLNPFLANFFKENKGIKYLIAHELTHTQQKGGDMEDRRRTNLLGFCLAEGMCDFMAEHLLQKPLPQPYILYGRQHHRELWATFRDSLHGSNIGPWLYNSGNTKLKMADVGYYMGYAICTAYYNKSKDKKKAITDILTLDLESPAALDDFLTQSGYGDNIDSSHHVPLDKNLSKEWRSALYSNTREAYKDKDLYTIGMPCGGIGAGQLYVRGDGTLAGWWICNNAYNTGYGADSLTHFNTALGPDTVCYKTFRPASYIDQGFSITVTQGDNRQTRTLNKEGFDDIAFTGEYPIANIAYDDTKKKLPVTVSAEVYSPFIPLNARESATPATIVGYTVTNTSNQPVTATINGWLQNLVCLDIAPDINALSRNRIVKSPGMTSVLMDIIPGPPIPPSPKPVLKPFDDFESGYSQWTVTGTAFGSAPAAGSFGGDQDKLLNMGGHGVVNSWLHGDTSLGKMVSQDFIISDDYIVFMIGGGKHEGLTCFNLVVNKKIVCTATGKNTEGLDQAYWDVKKWKGKKAHFEIVDASRGDWGHINLDDIAFSDRAPVKDKYFPAGHPYNGNLALSVLSSQGVGDAEYTGLNDSQTSDLFTRTTGEPAIGAVGSTITLQPGETRTITFYSPGSSPTALLIIPAPM